MPILMFAVATVISLEDRKINIMKGHKITFFMTLVIFIVVGFFPQKADGNVVYGLYKDGPKFFLYSAIAFASIIGFYIIMKYFKNHKNFFKIIISSLSAFCIIAGLVYIQLGKQVSSNHEWIVENLVEKQLTRDILGENEDSFFRVDFPSSFDNLGMYWDYPSLTAFHSVVPQSITDFYTDIGVKRGVASRPETSYFGVRGMTSVKYYFQRGSGDAAPPMPGFEYVKDSNGVRIYKNQYFVPIGFTYDQYVSEKSYSTITKENKDKDMMRAIVLNDAQIVKYGKLLNQANLIGLDDETEETYFENCKKRAASSCKTFSKDNTGFNATIDLEKENLVFFSVPYEKGWSVEVNGQKADIEKVN
ncbi:MAG: YfhO family protein, partial [Oscillospiraceae bacterium]